MRFSTDNNDSHNVALPPCLEVTAYCYENDVDVEALEQAHYVSDQGDIANCFLDEPNRVPEHPSSNANNSSAGSNKTIMAFRHQSLPIWGVQFHPESICTEYGSQMVENFMHLTADWMSKVRYSNMIYVHHRLYY